MAVCIGTDTVDGVLGTGIGMALGVLFSSSATLIVVVFKGVLNGMLLGSTFCTGCSLCVVAFKSSEKFVMLVFDDAVEDIGENGFRINGDSTSRDPKECFLMGRPATSKPLLPTISIEKTLFTRCYIYNTTISKRK